MNIEITEKVVTVLDGWNNHVEIFFKVDGGRERSYVMLVNGIDEPDDLSDKDALQAVKVYVESIEAQKQK